MLFLSSPTVCFNEKIHTVTQMETKTSIFELRVTLTEYAFQMVRAQMKFKGEREFVKTAETAERKTTEKGNK